jgi:hypothetical protein
MAGAPKTFTNDLIVEAYNFPKNVVADLRQHWML